MQTCWAECPAERPTFGELHVLIQEMAVNLEAALVRTATNVYNIGEPRLRERTLSKPQSYRTTQKKLKSKGHPEFPFETRQT